jgi:cell division protein FtsW
MGTETKVITARKQRVRKTLPDTTLIVLTSILVLFGVIMSYSASAIYWQLSGQGSGFYFLFRQLSWAAIGFGLMYLMSHLKYDVIKRLIMPLFLVSLGLLIAVLFSPAVRGAHRWLSFGLLNFQPSEVAKLALVMYLADYIDRKQSKMSELKKFVPPVIVGFLFCILVYLEPDLGTAVLLVTITLVVLYIGGARLSHISAVILGALPIIYLSIMCIPWRRHRIDTFLDLLTRTDVSGQLGNSLVAIASGGVGGRGLGASVFKITSLPEPHTDFIFAVIGEELGFVGTTAILVIFAWLAWRGFLIALRTPDLFGRLLSGGIILTILLGVCFNLGVVTGCLPTKGISLPFISYGGSSLILNMAAIGLVLAVSRRT